MTEVMSSRLEIVVATARYGQVRYLSAGMHWILQGKSAQIAQAIGSLNCN